jgi:TetR/AcrR family transcriptional regulator, transcriptional repressor for nem operon
MARNHENTHQRILDAAEPLVTANGFAGTSIDDILKSAGLTKGAFFHHFKSKADLARELIERHARHDIALFEQLAAEAEKKSQDPLERMILFLEGFEKYASSHMTPSLDVPPGCMYAAYTYESMQFEPAIRDFIADSLRRWTSIYVRNFEDVLDRYKPALPVTARQLAEMIVSIIQGGLMLGRAYNDIRMTARQSEQFRNYLALLFDGGKAAPPKQTRAPRAVVKAYA